VIPIKKLKVCSSEHLPVVHISIAFVVYRHHVQEHDVGGGWFESVESYLDGREHPPMGGNKKTTRTTHSLWQAGKQPGKRRVYDRNMLFSRGNRRFWVLKKYNFPILTKHGVITCSSGVDKHLRVLWKLHDWEKIVIIRNVARNLITGFEEYCLWSEERSFSWKNPQNV
jgi:hypothetical protein